MEHLSARQHRYKNHAMAAPMEATVITPTAVIERNVRENIRTLLALHQMTANALGEHLGLASSQISQRMTGKGRFTMAEAVQVAEVLGVSIETLLRNPAEVRERVQNWKMMERAAGGAMPGAPREARHLTPVVSRTDGFSDAAISGPMTLDLPPTLKIVR